MTYADTERHLRAGGVVILDGGTGTELERRGVRMDKDAWCGPGTLENVGVLEAIHRDYIAASADIVTANTYASSRLMLGSAGLVDRFDEINRAAVDAAHRARDASGRDGILVAGSLSHMCPMSIGTAEPDPARSPSAAEVADAMEELATLLREAGCDLIILEMMYDPERIVPALTAATKTGLPVWAGFSARRGPDGRLLGFAPDREISLDDIVQILRSYHVAAAGIMHTPSNDICDSLTVLKAAFDGPLMAYPDSGFFKMPNWQFEDVMSPIDFLGFAEEWIGNGVQIVGGCCGLSPEHIAALRPLKRHRS
jgi:S-methylmethionine-dependent homocysteine/selenocysteine methylase